MGHYAAAVLCSRLSFAFWTSFWFVHLFIMKSGGESVRVQDRFNKLYNTNRKGLARKWNSLAGCDALKLH